MSSKPARPPRDRSKGGFGSNTNVTLSNQGIARFWLFASLVHPVFQPSQSNIWSCEVACSDSYPARQRTHHVPDSSREYNTHESTGARQTSTHCRCRWHWVNCTNVLVQVEAVLPAGVAQRFAHLVAPIVLQHCAVAALYLTIDTGYTHVFAERRPAAVLAVPGALLRRLAGRFAVLSENRQCHTGKKDGDDIID